MADGTSNVERTESHELAQVDRYDMEGLTFAQRVALDPTIDVERLSRIIDMERDSDRYKAERAYAKAMAEMQSALPAVIKSGDNTHLKSKYAKLEDIQSAVRPLLAEHGFSVRWGSETIDNKIHVTCILTHKDGHSERDTLPLPVMTDNKGVNALQQHGITMSYGKRYTLCNVLGIQLGGEDNDGANEVAETLGPDEMTILDDLLKETGADRAKFFKYAKVEGMADIHMKNFEALKKILEGKRTDK